MPTVLTKTAWAGSTWQPRVPVASSYVNFAVGFGDICGESQCAHAPARLFAHGSLEVCCHRGTLFVTDTCPAVDCKTVGFIEQHLRRDDPVRLVFSSKHRAMLWSSWDSADERLLLSW